MRGGCLSYFFVDFVSRLPFQSQPNWSGEYGVCRAQLPNRSGDNGGRVRNRRLHHQDAGEMGSVSQATWLF